MRTIFALTALLMVSCNGSPTYPHGTSSTGTSSTGLPTGRYSSDEACVSITETEGELVAGCWHGRFARPMITGGRFNVTGTFGFEGGPVKNEPAPPATFSGTIAGTSLTITVERTDKSAPATTFTVTLAGAGNCPQLCV